MNSLYGRLFRYRERAERSPLEDFLSEALADLLNRLPDETSIDFVAQHFMPSGQGCVDWLRYAAQTQLKNLVWSTQRNIGKHGRLDLLLEGNGVPLLVVENKITAGFAHRSEPTREDGGTEDAVDSATRHQLHDYGSWLSRQLEGSGWGGALALLTHATPAPRDFGSSAAYGVPWQRVCRWHQLWRWLQSAGSAERQGGSPLRAWQQLAAELADFAEEKGMASETMTPYDLAALQVYVASAARVDATLDRIRERLRSNLSNIAKGKQIERYYFDRPGLFQFVYLTSPPAPPKGGWHLAWGIRFPMEEEPWWDDIKKDLPGAPYVALYLAPDKEEAWRALENVGSRMPAGWLRSTEGYSLVAARPLHEFPLDSSDLADGIAEWAKSKVDGLEPLIPKLKP